MKEEQLYKLYDKHKNEFNFVDRECFLKIIKDILNLHNIEMSKLQIKLSELEAKVYAYEKIIANSNFKPILGTELNEISIVGSDKE